MTAELKSILDGITLQARKNLEQCGRLMPVAFLIGEKISIVGCPWRNDAEKETSLILLRGMAREKEARIVVILAEAWFAKLPGSLETWDGVPASRRPDKTEGVMFYIETLDGCWNGQAEIKRTNGKPTFGEVVYSPAGERDARERLQNILA